MAQHADASKERFWLEVVRRWQQSQLTVRAFCQRHRLSEPSFYAWRRVLRLRGLLDPRSNDATAPGPAFVNVTLATVDADAAAAIDLVLKHDRVLRVRAGFDAELLRQLVRVLEEPAC